MKYVTNPAFCMESADLEIESNPQIRKASFDQNQYIF